MSTKYGSTKDSKTDSKGNEEAASSGTSKKLKQFKYFFKPGQHFYYGFGHVYNDLAASMWFSYMMLFLQAVLEIRAVIAGVLILLGQVVDAVATPIAGYLVDRYSSKKTWHLGGAVMVTVSFTPLFIRCYGCWLQSDTQYLRWWMPVYYAILVIFFQIGWAIVQIAHLSMIPAISSSNEERYDLTSIRYMCSVASSMTVYIVTWVVLRSSDYSSYIRPTDDYKFRNVSLIISSIGVLTTAVFHFLFKLPSAKKEKKGKENGSITRNGIAIDDTAQPKSKFMYFLKMPQLYQTILLYVFARMYWTLSIVYIPLFIDERLYFNPTGGSELVATVPLVIYISSFFTTLILKRTIAKCGNEVAYLVGSIISLSSCAWLAFGAQTEAGTLQVYLVATLIGAGSSITLVASLCVTAALIGPHSHQGATIYAIVTFADKLITGVAVVIIEDFKCEKVINCPHYYRGVLSYVCGGCVCLGILSLVFTKMSKYCKLAK